MLTYSFQDTGNDSLYEYLYKCIRQDILEGRIRAGEKLPSKRSFAKNLGISTITVENAYAQLVAEGYIYAVPRSGYYAAQISACVLTPAQEQSMPVPAGPEKGLQKEEEPPVADLVKSHTDPGQFPFTIWARIMREVLSQKREALMNNAPGSGVEELRSAIARYLLQYQGMRVSEDQLIIGAGTEYLYGLLIQLLGQDKVYALEDPGYVKMGKVYRSHRVRMAYIPMDESGVCVDRLRESGADVMHITPSHHYPTGITTPIGRRYELLNWAYEKEDRYIIEDDYDCEFRMAGRPIPSLQSIDCHGRVIYMNTFTKSLASTIRISYMVLPGELLERFREKLGFYACTVSNFEQYTLAAFIGEGYFEKHINRTRNYYREKRDSLLAAIRDSRLGEHVSILAADAGLHFLMQVDTELTDPELESRAAREGIRLSCLSDYYHSGDPRQGADENLTSRTGQESPVRHMVVVNYCGLEKEQMLPMAEALYRAWFL